MIRDRRRAAWTLLLALPLAVVLGWLSLSSISVAAVGSQSCWHAGPDAWQRMGQLALLGAAWIAAILMVRLFYLRRVWAAAVAGFAWLALVAGWIALVFAWFVCLS